jgi:hypothetical protein
VAAEGAVTSFRVTAIGKYSSQLTAQESVKQKKLVARTAASSLLNTLDKTIVAAGYQVVGSDDRLGKPVDADTNQFRRNAGLS